MRCACFSVLNRLPRVPWLLCKLLRLTSLYPMIPTQATRTGLEPTLGAFIHSFMPPCPAPAHCQHSCVEVVVLTTATLYPCPSPGCPMSPGPTLLLGDIAGAASLLLCHLQDSGVRLVALGQSPVALHGPILTLGLPRLGTGLCTPHTPTLSPAASPCTGPPHAHTSVSTAV